MRLFRRCCLSLILLSATAFLPAAQTGTISGIVKAGDGTALPGVTVAVSGALLPKGREATSGADGRFWFPYLPPGDYVVKASLPGLGEAARGAVVEVDRETVLEISLDPAVQEKVTVEAVTPMIDTRSSEVADNFSRSQIAKLPLGRSYRALFELTPGVAQNNRTAPNAGGLRQDNVFLYDGVNITDPFFADRFQNFSELDIQEVNIKRGGITAEFGSTGGFVINAVTRSGTNTFHGDARFVFQPAELFGVDLQAENRDKSITSKTDSFTPAAGVGGPILRDRLWFYGSGSLIRETVGDRVNLLGKVPDADTDIDEYFVKLTSAPIEALYLSGSFRYRGTDTTNSGIGSQSSPTVATHGKSVDRVIVLDGTYFFSPNLLLNIKYNHNENNNGIQPVTDLGYRPPFNAADPSRSGNFRTAPGFIVGGATASGQFVGSSERAINDQDFFRDEVRGVLSLYGNSWGASHEVKLGGGLNLTGEDLTRRANGWGGITVSTSAGICGAAGTPCFRARYFPEQPTQVSRGRNYGIFLQDQVGVGERLTFTLGLLANRDEYIGNEEEGGFTLIKFDFEETLQPRVGVTYVTNPRLRDKAYASYGRHYLMENKSLSRAAAPFRIFRSVAIFSRNGTLVSDAPEASTTNKRVLPGIRPTYMDEFVAGYERPIFRSWTGSLWGMYREKRDVIEDFPTVDVNTTSPKNYVYDNLETSYVRYKAVTLELNRAFAEKWSANLSYTWSRLEGNWDLDHASGEFYASSLIQDGPGYYIEDPNRNGILIGDREHIFKLFGHYQLPWRTVIGGYLRIQSGAPWEARGTAYENSYFRYLERAGSHRLETWTNFDLSVGQDFAVGTGLDLHAEVRVLNLFDNQPVLTIDQRADQPTFKRPTSFASPRRLVLQAGLRF